jgi:hypothetical protein
MAETSPSMPHPALWRRKARFFSRQGECQWRGLSTRRCWGELLSHPGRDRGCATAEGGCAAGEMGSPWAMFPFDFWFESPDIACMCCCWYVAHDHRIYVFSMNARLFATDSEF